MIWSPHKPFKTPSDTGLRWIFNRNLSRCFVCCGYSKWTWWSSRFAWSFNEFNGGVCHRRAAASEKSENSYRMERMEFSVAESPLKTKTKQLEEYKQAKNAVSDVSQVNNNKKPVKPVNGGTKSGQHVSQNSLNWFVIFYFFFVLLKKSVVYSFSRFCGLMNICRAAADRCHNYSCNCPTSPMKCVTLERWNPIKFHCCEIILWDFFFPFYAEMYRAVKIVLIWCFWQNVFQDLMLMKNIYLKHFIWRCWLLCLATVSRN